MSMTFKGLVVPRGPGKLLLRYAEQYYAEQTGESSPSCVYSSMCGVSSPACSACVWSKDAKIALEFIAGLLKCSTMQADYKVGTRPRLTPDQNEAVRNLRAVCEDIVRAPESNRDFSMLYKAGYTLSRISDVLEPLMPYEALELTCVRGMGFLEPWRTAAGLSGETGFVIAHLDGELLNANMLEADAFLFLEEGRRVQYWEAFGNSAEESIVRFVLALSGSELSAQDPFELLPEEQEELSTAAF